MTNDNTTHTDTEFEKALTAWLATAQEIIEVNHERAGYHSPAATLSTMYGRRYVRIVRHDLGPSRSAHCFIDRTNGDVLKAASWKAPAKNFARGNIYTGNAGVTEYGAHTCY